MCGISGFISSSPRPPDFIHNMTNLIRHRGPNDEGYLLIPCFTQTPIPAYGKDTPSCDDQFPWRPHVSIENSGLESVYIALGHRRLSVLDPSPIGHQPMSYKNNRYWMVYNGEIYNYLELRKELIDVGYKFMTSTDTEVIMAAYDHWGLECQNHFEGMWSIAIIDLEKQTLFLSRDRFGIKPLYYWVSSDGSLYFGSEIKLFTALPEWSATLNSQRTYDYLVWGLMDHTDETLFKGVYQISPGCYTRIPLRQKKFRPFERLPMVRWYSLSAKPYTGGYETATYELRKKLQHSIAMHLRSDITVGSCLSGGIDSSAIVCMVNDQIIKTQSGALQKTFSACSDVKAYDEQKWISEVLNNRKIDAHYVYPRLHELFQDLPKIIWHQDEPFGSTSIYAQWKVFELAAQKNIFVLLDGQGADEQLAGYHTYFAVWFSKLFKRRRFRKLWQNIQSVYRIHNYSTIHAIARIVNIIASDWVRNFMKRRMGKLDKNPRWLVLDKLKAKPIDPHISLGSYTDSIYKFSKAQLTGAHLQALLHWEDRDSMAHSIESRVPFLDHNLVEFTLSLPDEYKLSDGLTKKILRDSLLGIIPDKIRERTDKLGFVTPEEVWIRQTDTALFRDKIKGAIERLDGILKPEALDYFDEIVNGRQSFTFAIWRILNLAAWLDVFNVQLPTSGKNAQIP